MSSYAGSNSGSIDADEILKSKALCGAPRTGRSSSGPGPCQNPAGFRTSHPGFGHCVFHLGETKSHRVAAAREEVRQRLKTYGAPIAVDPGVALLQEVHRTAGHVAWLASQIEDSEGPGLPDGALLTLYQRERDHLVRTCKSALDVGIAEREVRFAERQGQVIAGMLMAALAALNLTAEQYAQARMVVAAHMRATVVARELPA